MVTAQQAFWDAFRWPLSNPQPWTCLTIQVERKKMVLSLLPSTSGRVPTALFSLHFSTNLTVVPRDSAKLSNPIQHVVATLTNRLGWQSVFQGR
jgi:hypothetical protein